MHIKVGELMSILKTATIPESGHGRPAPGPRRPSPPPPPRASGAYFFDFDQRVDLDSDKCFQQGDHHRIMGHTKGPLDVVGDINDGFRSLSLESSQSLVALECTLPMLRTARMINTMYPYRSLNHGKRFQPSINHLDLYLSDYVRTHGEMGILYTTKVHKRERLRFPKQEYGDSEFLLISQLLEASVSKARRSRAEGNAVMSLVLAHHIARHLTIKYLPLSRRLDL